MSLIVERFAPGLKNVFCQRSSQIGVAAMEPPSCHFGQLTVVLNFACKRTNIDSGAHGSHGNFFSRFFCTRKSCPQGFSWNALKARVQVVSMRVSSMTLQMAVLGISQAHRCLAIGSNAKHSEAVLPLLARGYNNNCHICIAINNTNADKSCTVTLAS